MKTIYGNIKKNYIYQFISSASFSEAIWMLFLAYRGMSLVEIGLLEAIFHITAMICEVPTGFIADRFGRRTSRIIGRIVAMASSLLMLSAHSFAMFAVAFVFNALCYNLESGAGDALIYDSLVQSKKEDEFMKVKGRQEVSFQAARLFSLVAGGLVATFSYELAYLLTLAIHLSALSMAFTFIEPSVYSKDENVGLFRHMKQSLKAIWDNRRMLKYILFLEGFSMLYTTLYFYFQNFLKSKSYVEYQIGMMLAATAVAGMLAASVAYRIEKRIGEKRLIIFVAIVFVLLFSAIAWTSVEPVAIILLSGLEGILFVVFSDYINKQIPSEHRATLLSFQSMTFSIMMIVFFPVVGSIAQASGFKTAFTVIAMISVLVAGLTTLLLLKKRPE